MTQPDSVTHLITPTPGVDIAFPLGRHVNHDPRSRRYAYPVRAADLAAVFHERHVPVFDQGTLGSCTGNAGLGILATGPYWEDLTPAQQASGPDPTLPWNENGAVHLYSVVTYADNFPGQYPPEDTGSDGLTVAKVLTSNNIVSGYQHTFSTSEAVAALMSFPLLTGTVWTQDMFSPDEKGRIRPTGYQAGGHEWIVDEYVPAGFVARSGAVLSRVASYIGGTSSWGTAFGVGGRFYLSVADYDRLLKQEGDVIVLTPPAAPEPVPTPAPVPAGDADADLATAMRAWLSAKGL